MDTKTIKEFKRQAKVFTSQLTEEMYDAIQERGEEYRYNGARRDRGRMVLVAIVGKGDKRMYVSYQANDLGQLRIWRYCDIFGTLATKLPISALADAYELLMDALTNGTPAVELVNGKDRNVIRVNHKTLEY